MQLKPFGESRSKTKEESALTALDSGSPRANSWATASTPRAGAAPSLRDECARALVQASWAGHPGTAAGHLVSALHFSTFANSFAKRYVAFHICIKTNKQTRKPPSFYQAPHLKGPLGLHFARRGARPRLSRLPSKPRSFSSPGALQLVPDLAPRPGASRLGPRLGSLGRGALRPQSGRVPLPAVRGALRGDSPSARIGFEGSGYFRRASCPQVRLTAHAGAATPRSRG